MEGLLMCPPLWPETDCFETWQLCLWLPAFDFLAHIVAKEFMEALGDVSVFPDQDTDHKKQYAKRYNTTQIFCTYYILTLLYTDHVNICLQNWDPWIIHLVVWQVYPRQSSLFVQCTNLIRQHIKVKGIFKWYHFHTGYTQGLYAAIITFTCLQYEIQLT